MNKRRLDPSYLPERPMTLVEQKIQECINCLKEHNIVALLVTMQPGPKAGTINLNTFKTTDSLILNLDMLEHAGGLLKQQARQKALEKSTNIIPVNASALDRLPKMNGG